jgi:hypothetical protein
MIGSRCDRNTFFSTVEAHFPDVPASNLWEETGAEASRILDTYWNAVQEIAQTLTSNRWLPVDPNENHPKLTRKKQLDGSGLVTILAKHGISAKVC